MEDFLCLYNIFNNSIDNIDTGTTTNIHTVSVNRCFAGQRKEDQEENFPPTITEISVETLLRALAIVVSLLMVRFLREIYHQVPAEDDENEEAGNDEEDE